MRSFRVFFGSALACWLVCAASSVRAEDVNWTYSWSGTTTVLNDQGGGVKFNFGTGGYANTQSGVTAATLEAFGPAGTIVNGTYNLSMHLVETKSHDYADLTFGGTLSGPTSLALQNVFSAPLVRTAGLGGNDFGVIIGLYSAPGLAGSGIQGILGTNVVVTPGTGNSNGTGATTGPPVSNVPEPSTLILGGLGLSVMALRWGWRKRCAVVQEETTTAPV